MTLEGGRIRAKANVAPTMAEPRESRLQSWLGDASANDAKSDLLIYLNRATNWFDIYKGLDLIRRLAGDEQALKGQLGPDWNDFKNVWRTANTHRHAPGAQRARSEPAELGAARKLLLSVAQRFL